jgi:hypothetical protein
LTGNAPVGPVANHTCDPVYTPIRHPGYVLAGFNRLFLERIHGTEPLIRRPVDNRILAAPAMRILVHNRLRGKKRARSREFLNNRVVGLVIIHSVKHSRFLRHEPSCVDGHYSSDIGFSAVVIYTADHIVFHTVSGRGMHAAGSGLKSNMIAQQDDRFPVKKRVFRGHQFKLAAFNCPDNFIIFKLCCLCNRLNEFLRYDVNLSGIRFDKRVIKFRIQADRKFARQSPGRGCPDQK